MHQDLEVEFTNEELEIVELPQREAMAKGGIPGPNKPPSSGGSTINFFGIFIDLF
jgi:hypothetical protein